MWTASIESLDGVEGQRFTLLRDGEPVDTATVFAAWRDDDAFRGFFGDVLARAPFDAFYFETPPVTRDSLGRTFEFVLLTAPALASAGADGSPFAEHFAGAPADAEVITFANLGGDAQLVVPCPRTADPTYAHLASFTRSAPHTQRQALWRELGMALERSLDARPTWVSTAGGGVYWLHLRLDARPKYYRHAPYRRQG